MALGEHFGFPSTDKQTLRPKRKIWLSQGPPGRKLVMLKGELRFPGLLLTSYLEFAAKYYGTEETDGTRGPKS